MLALVSRSKKSTLNVDVVSSDRGISSNRSFDFDHAGPMESEERASRLYSLKHPEEEPERFSMSELDKGL